MSDNGYVPAADGMLAYLVGRVSPKLAGRIAATGKIETAHLAEAIQYRPRRQT